MAKNSPSYDDEIDILDLVLVFFSHKWKFILLGLLGLILALPYTYQLEPRYETKFKIQLNHPLYDHNKLIRSSNIQELLNKSELNPNLLPNYNFNKKRNIFVVVTEERDVRPMVTEIFVSALKNGLSDLKMMAKNLTGYENKPIILNNNNNLNWTNENIARLDLDETVKDFKISFSKTKTLNPSPLRHGAIGLFIGLVLAFCWMIASISIRQIALKKQGTVSSKLK